MFIVNILVYLSKQLKQRVMEIQEQKTKHLEITSKKFREVTGLKGKIIPIGFNDNGSYYHPSVRINSEYYITAQCDFNNNYPYAYEVCKFNSDKEMDRFVANKISVSDTDVKLVIQNIKDGKIDSIMLELDELDSMIESINELKDYIKYNKLQLELRYNDFELKKKELKLKLDKLSIDLN